MDEAAIERFEAWARRASSSRPTAEGVALARARQAALASLIRLNPRRALERALAAAVRDRLPEAVRAHLEQPVMGTGVLEVVAVDDFDPDGTPDRERYVRILHLDGRAYRAYVYGRRLDLATTRLHVFGIAVGFSDGLLSIDGVLVGAAGGDLLARITGNGNGGSPRTTGYQPHEVDLGTLAAGTHTLALGGYNNLKTLANESTEVVVDEVIVSRP